MPIEPIADLQTVTPDGVPVAARIADVVIRPAVTHLDERGEVCEVYSPAWDIHPEPMVYAYLIGIRPGQVKGWVVHRLQDDRLFSAFGTVKLVLYDDRAESPTHGMLNEMCFGERHRALIVIPKGVYHAVQNVGDVDAALFNLPTQPFDHARPDKYRLPLDTDRIPYRFTDLRR